MTSPFHHCPVLLQESIEHLQLAPGDFVIDGTVGAGGHAAAILQATAPNGRLLGLDLDSGALTLARDTLAPFGGRVDLQQASVGDLASVLDTSDRGTVDAIFFDLGVSSMQLDDPKQGFRFAEETAATTKLDMRMNPAAGAGAAEVLNRATEAELSEMFRRYGELRGSYRLAKAIVETRQQHPFEYVADLLKVIRATGVGGGRKHHPATLVFQALRIQVNQELDALDQGLEASFDLLKIGGRIGVISYHSLEDRLVKQRFRREVKGCICPSDIPVCICHRQPRLSLPFRRSITPNAEELRKNPRARSARLRIAQRVEEPE